jgi:hypothetical protein
MANSQKKKRCANTETGTRLACRKRILRSVGPDGSSLARRLSEILRVRSRCSLPSE